MIAPQEVYTTEGSRRTAAVRVEVEAGGIHPELKTFDHWVVWKAVPKDDGKIDKVPYNARTGEKASSTDSRTWSSFEEVIAAYVRDGWDGVGYVLTSGDPYTAIDLDGVRDPDTGAVEPWAQEVIENFGSYVEVSPSGKGVHIFIRGELTSKEGKKRGGIEAYSMKRFFTVSGVKP